MVNAQPSPLACGDVVEFTVYDFLKGIARRNEHKPYPEPEVAMIFKKSESDNAVDLFEVEMGLRKAYHEVSLHCSLSTKLMVVITSCHALACK